MVSDHRADKTGSDPPGGVASGRAGAALVAAVIFACALAVRLLYLWDSADNPTFGEPIVDARTYHQLALSLVEEGSFSERLLWQPVFYPLFLAGVYRLLGPAILLVKLWQALLGAGACAITYLVGRRAFGAAAGLAGAIIVTLNGPLIFFEAELLATGWATFWAVLLLLMLDRAGKPAGAWLYAGLGLCGALSFLTRTTFLPFLLAGLWWLALRLRKHGLGWPAELGRISAVLAGAVLVVAPVALVDHHHTGHAGLVPAAAGLNLYVGNNEDFPRTVTIRPGYEWRKLTAEPAREAGSTNQWDDSRYFQAKVARFARERPGMFLSGLGQKALQLAGSRELPRNVDVYGHRPWSPLLSALVWKWHGFGFPFGIILPLAVVGLLLGWRAVPVPLRLFILLYAASIVLVFVAARYRVVMVPAFAILAGQGIVLSGRFLRRRQWRKLATAAAVAGAVVVIGTVPGPFAQEKIAAEAEIQHGVGYNLYAAERWNEAADRFRRAIAGDENLMEAHHYLGVCLLHLGQPIQAADQFTAAARLDPTFAPAARRLAAIAPVAAAAHFDSALAAERNDRIALAASHYARAVRLQPEWPEALGHLSWILATSKIDSVRDGRRAVTLARTANELTANRDPWLLGTLAAALAEAGLFADAVATLDEAIDIATTADQAGPLPYLHEMRELFREGRPHRE